ncbi:Wzz/FepE/Etk N-terminal domain-containing protein [Nocardioides astragali]|uniref:Wzz/FepE/Etk N-terminal domain-containing protein n=1 Tax=Nocardioides astragali TaxID=1776736 RepID=A0ABW2N4J7_9ACTN|nr:Wzz/FepE/Etk N-terminal domain-containing protein [Nocardioides astragali]
MAEQPLDLRSTLSILRRRRRVLAAAAVAGVAAGVAFALANPPMYGSTSQVLLPSLQGQSGEAVSRDVRTDVTIAESDAVLGEAGRNLTPPVPLKTLRKRVEVEAMTGDILSFRAMADTAEEAEDLAHTVAEAEVAYVQHAANTLSDAEVAALTERRAALERSLETVEGEILNTHERLRAGTPGSASAKADAAALARLTAEEAKLVLQIDQVKGEVARAAPLLDATILQNASPGERPSPVITFTLAAMIAMVAALVLCILVLLLLAKKDRRVRYRDDIADALGTLVVGSAHSRVPRTVAGWASLIETYVPGPVEAVAMRQTLRRLGQAGPGTGEASDRSVAVITLSGDPRGLSYGPQLAAYAASAGLDTRLLAAEGHESAAPLWAACSSFVAHADPPPHLTVQVGKLAEDATALTIVMAVVDREHPALTDLPRVSSTVVAVSSGAATADELARLALAADSAGIQLDGLIVVDPEDLDRTTGHLSRRDRDEQRPLPTRLTGLPSYRLGQAGRQQ